MKHKVSYLRQQEAQGAYAPGKKNFPTRFLSAEGCYSWQAVREPGVRRCPIVASSHAAAAASQSPSSSESVSPSGFCGRFAFAGFGGR